MPAAVLFDFDGVIVDTEWAIYQAWARTYEREGETLLLSTYTQCIGSDFDTWSPKLHLESLTKRSFDWEKMDADRQVEIRKELEGEGLMEGIIELLERLKARRVPLAVVSSSSHDWVDDWLEKLNIRSFFSQVICKGDAANIKPAPDLYIAAADLLQVDPKECLVIEDSGNGLAAGLAAGMRVWAVPNRVTTGLDFASAEKVFRSSKALRCELAQV